MIPWITLHDNTHLVRFIMPDLPCCIFSLVPLSTPGLQHHWRSTTKCSFCRFPNIHKMISPVRDICYDCLHNIAFIMCFQSHHFHLSTPSLQHAKWSCEVASLLLDHTAPGAGNWYTLKISHIFLCEIDVELYQLEMHRSDTGIGYWLRYWLISWIGYQMNEADPAFRSSLIKYNHDGVNLVCVLSLRFCPLQLHKSSWYATS